MTRCDGVLMVGHAGIVMVGYAGVVMVGYAGVVMVGCTGVLLSQRSNDRELRGDMLERGPHKMCWQVMRGVVVWVFMWEGMWKGGMMAYYGRM